MGRPVSQYLRNRCPVFTSSKGEGKAGKARFIPSPRNGQVGRGLSNIIFVNCEI